jgi:hypothetical protein
LPEDIPLCVCVERGRHTAGAKAVFLVALDARAYLESKDNGKSNGSGESNTEAATADPCGMTNKTTESISTTLLFRQAVAKLSDCGFLYAHTFRVRR